MNRVTNSRKITFSPIPPALQALVALVVGLALFVTFLLGTVAVFNFYYGGAIFPGISIAGLDLSGLAPDQAAGQLVTHISYPQTGKITFQDGGKIWIAQPSELGLNLDIYTSALAAYSYGRQGGLLTRLSQQYSAWHSGHDLAPVLVYDERLARAYLENLATQINRPSVEASLQVNGVDVIVEAGQIGRRVDIPATLESLRKQVSSLQDGVIPLVVVETTPAILDARQQAEIARQILGTPLTLQLPDASEEETSTWTFEPSQLAEMLTIERLENTSGATYQVSVKADPLRSFLLELAPQILRFPKNTRFIFNDDTRLLEIIQPAVIGRALEIDATIEAINQRLVQGEHTIPLVIDYSQPAVTDDISGAALGITELVSVHTSYFRGSSKERMQNIQTSASRFHGLLVPPGAIFSMAEVMGTVSLDEGYAEALIIFGGRTIKGVGGGVCQVSTTLFRTVFQGGFPIIERHPHAYRVGYYEQTANGWDSNLAGLDATVFVPVVDFKFQNDTPYWLLMETYFNARAQTLTWKFYSTSDGRTVEWDTSGPTNIVDPPEAVYEENPELAAGEIKQVDWAAEGADVTITRVVYRDGQVYFTDNVVTHYLPWRDVFQYGPGTELPDTQSDE